MFDSCLDRWGDSVIRFSKCLEGHAKDHELPNDTAYWVCAYANNQHDVGGDVTADPSESSFVKAVSLACCRVLSIVDEKGVTYDRIWCCLEVRSILGAMPYRPLPLLASHCCCRCTLVFSKCTRCTLLYQR